MKTGQIFWGIFFLAIGALILLTKYDLLICNWDFVWDLWPLLLVFIGLMIITRKTTIKPIVNLIFGLFVAILVFGTLYNLFYFTNYCDKDFDYSVEQIYSEEYDGSEYASLYVEAGAGIFNIKRTTDLLVKGIARGAFADYNFYTYDRGNSTKIEFDMGRTSYTIFDGKVRNNLEVELNNNPVWDMRLDIGAATAKLDLSPYKVREIELNTGATKVLLKLGDLYDKTDVRVEMGAASLEIDIPKNSGCKLTGKMFLVSKDIPGFIKKSKRYYITPNYDEAANKIDIDIQGGVASLEINRY